LIFIFALEYTTREVQESLEGMELNEIALQFLICAGGVNRLGDHEQKHRNCHQKLTKI
jgi:hypothetical protein